MVQIDCLIETTPGDGSPRPLDRSAVGREVAVGVFGERRELVLIGERVHGRLVVEAVEPVLNTDEVAHQPEQGELGRRA